MSDFHFGIEEREHYSAAEIAARSNSMKEATNKILSISRHEPFDYIFLTGDFGWTASKEDYKKCVEWLQELLVNLDIDVSKIFLCPGNHDIDRDIMVDIEYPNDQSSANQKLKIERLELLNNRFSNYIEFCEKLGLKPYKIGNKESMLVGIRENKNCNIVCLNTAWFAKDDHVQDYMWVGANFIEIIKHQLSGISGKPVITIMHHPETSWHEDERGNFEGKENVYTEICKFSDIVFHGHTHETSSQDQLHQNALIAGSGAFYQARRYPHNFYVYDIDFENPNAMQYRTQYYLLGDKWLTMEENLFNPKESIFLAPWVMKNYRFE